MSEEQAQKLDSDTDDVSVRRSGQCFWLVTPRGKITLTNQKHYPDLESNTISIEFLQSFLRPHFAVELVVGSQNISCFLLLIKTNWNNWGQSAPIWKTVCDWLEKQ